MNKYILKIVWPTDNIDVVMENFFPFLYSRVFDQLSRLKNPLELMQYLAIH